MCEICAWEPTSTIASGGRGASALCTARRAAAAAAGDTACPTHPLSRGYESYSPRKQHVNATVLPLRRLRHRVLLHGRAALALLILG